MLDPSTTRRRPSKSFGQATFAGPVSSSIVRNITPFADPGI
jgi:hypothetical protein